MDKIRTTARGRKHRDMEVPEDMNGGETDIDSAVASFNDPNFHEQDEANGEDPLDELVGDEGFGADLDNPYEEAQPRITGRASTVRETPLFAVGAFDPQVPSLRVYKIGADGVRINIGECPRSTGEERFFQRFFESMPIPGESDVEFLLQPLNKMGQAVGQEIVYGPISPNHTYLAKLRAARAAGGGGGLGGVFAGTGIKDLADVVNLQRVLSADTRAEAEAIRQRNVAEQAALLAERQGIAHNQLEMANEAAKRAVEFAKSQIDAAVQTAASQVESERIRSAENVSMVKELGSASQQMVKESNSTIIQMLAQQIELERARSKSMIEEMREQAKTDLERVRAETAVKIEEAKSALEIRRLEIQAQQAKDAERAREDAEKRAEFIALQAAERAERDRERREAAAAAEKAAERRHEAMMAENKAASEARLAEIKMLMEFRQASLTQAANSPMAMLSQAGELAKTMGFENIGDAARKLVGEPEPSWAEQAAPLLEHGGAIAKSMFENVAKLGAEYMKQNTLREEKRFQQQRGGFGGQAPPPQLTQALRVPVQATPAPIPIKPMHPGAVAFAGAARSVQPSAAPASTAAAPVATQSSKLAQSIIQSTVDLLKKSPEDKWTEIIVKAVQDTPDVLIYLKAVGVTRALKEGGLDDAQLAAVIARPDLQLAAAATGVKI